MGENCGSGTWADSGEELELASDVLEVVARTKTIVSGQDPASSEQVLLSSTDTKQN